MGGAVTRFPGSVPNRHMRKKRPFDYVIKDSTVPFVENGRRKGHTGFGGKNRKLTTFDQRSRQNGCSRQSSKKTDEGTHVRDLTGRRKDELEKKVVHVMRRGLVSKTEKD